MATVRTEVRRHEQTVWLSGHEESMAFYRLTSRQADPTRMNRSPNNRIGYCKSCLHNKRVIGTHHNDIISHLVIALQSGQIESTRTVTSSLHPSSLINVYRTFLQDKLLLFCLINMPHGALVSVIYSSVAR